MLTCPVERDTHQYYSQDDTIYQEQIETAMVDIIEKLLSNGEWLNELRGDYMGYNDHLEENRLHGAMLGAANNEDRLAAMRAWYDWLAAHPGTILRARQLAQKKLCDDGK